MGGLYARPFYRSDICQKKVKITEKAFTDFTGVMFRTSFTKSVSDHPVNERMQNRITAAMRAVPVEPTVAVTGVSVSPEVGIGGGEKNGSNHGYRGACWCYQQESYLGVEKC